LESTSFYAEQGGNLNGKCHGFYFFMFQNTAFFLLSNIRFIVLENDTRTAYHDNIVMYVSLLIFFVLLNSILWVLIFLVLDFLYWSNWRPFWFIPSLQCPNFWRIYSSYWFSYWRKWQIFCGWQSYMQGITGNIYFLFINYFVISFYLWKFSLLLMILCRLIMIGVNSLPPTIPVNTCWTLLSGYAPKAVYP